MRIRAAPETGYPYKVYEIIREDAGGGSNDGLAPRSWVSKQDLRNFHDTANWHLTEGGRRAKPTKVPAKPMSLREAGVLVRELAKQWLETGII